MKKYKLTFRLIASLLLNKTRYDPGRWWSGMFNPVYVGFSYEHSQYTNSWLDSIILRNLTFVFITCSPLRRSTGMEAYFSPFDLPIWYFIIFGLFLVIPGYIFLVNQLNLTLEQLIDLMIVIYGSMFEVSDTITTKLGDGRVKHFYLVFGLWTLTGIVLTNGYRGIVTNDK